MCFGRFFLKIFNNLQTHTHVHAQQTSVTDIYSEQEQTLQTLMQQLAERTAQVTALQDDLKHHTVTLEKKWNHALGMSDVCLCVINHFFC